MLHYDDSLRNEVSHQYRSLATMARSGLKQALMKSELSAAVQDSHVMGLHPSSESRSGEGVLVDFIVHVSITKIKFSLANSENHITYQSLECSLYLCLILLLNVMIYLL